VWQFNKYSFGAAASVLLLFIFAGLIFYGIHLLVRERSIVQEEQGA
jgi:high-affinity Fe2+/Pb2+ permease